MSGPAVVRWGSGFESGGVSRGLADRRFSRGDGSSGGIADRRSRTGGGVGGGLVDTSFGRGDGVDGGLAGLEEEEVLRKRAGEYAVDVTGEGAGE